MTLAGTGLVLVEESYRRKAQQPFNPRFSTGDPGAGDLSYWQFLQQRGFTSEGQDRFDTITEYKQSAGWDLRMGRAYLARTLEALTITTTMPSMINTATFTLYEDFAAAGSPTVDKWNQCGAWGAVFAPTSGAAAYPGRRDVGGVYYGQSGFNNSAGGTLPLEAGVVDATPVMPACHSSSDLVAAGTWQFVVKTKSSALNVVHARILFLGNATGGYVLEIYGSNMNRARLLKTNILSSGVRYLCQNTADVVVKTFDGTGGTTAPVGGSDSDRTYKITRNSSGDFEVFENTVSLGTVTDTTYTGALYFGFSTYLASISAVSTSTYIKDIYLPGGSAENNAVGSKLLAYNGGLYTCWKAASAFAFTTVRTASVPNNIPKVVHQDARDQCLWSRDGNISDGTIDRNTHLVSVRGQVVRVYSGETQVLTRATTVFGTAVIALSPTKIMVLGTSAENNGVPMVEIVTVDANAWTNPANKVLTLEGGTSGTVSGVCVDSSSTVYFSTLDATNAYGVTPSRVYAISSTDYGATNPSVTRVYNTSDMSVRGLFAFNGVVYMHGAKVRGTESYAIVQRLNGTVVWESTKAIPFSPVTDAYRFNHGVLSVFANLDNVLFLGMNDLDLWAPVLQMDASENVREVASFSSGQFSYAYPNVVAIAEWSGRFYCLNGQAGTIVRTGTSRGALGASHSYAVLELSAMGANTDLITKTLYSVTVELSAAVPSGETLSVLVNDTVVGTMVAADGTRKEIILSAELTSSEFRTKLRWPQASTWTGYIKVGPILRYVPTQFKKKAWTFGVRCTKGLRDIEGAPVTTTPAAFLAALEAAYASNVPITLVDIDGTSYTVIVTDIDVRIPLMETDSTDLEFLVFLELLQV